MSTPGTNPATVNERFSDYMLTAMKAGFQFTEYLAPNGVTVKVRSR